MALRVRPRSAKQIKIPTEFAKFNSDLSVYEKPYTDCAGCENIGAPPEVVNALSRAIQAHPELIWDHWDSQDENLRNKIASFHQVDIDQVFITSGALAGIDHCFRIFSRAGTRTGLLRPDWPGFEHYAERYQNSATLIENLEFPFVISAEHISSSVAKGMLDFVVFANPMPVNGNLIDRSRLAELLEAHPDTMFVVDEADTVRPDRQGAQLAATHDNAVFLGSLSKFYGLSGLRIGYLVTPRAHAEHFRRTITAIEVSSIALLAGNLAWEQHEYLSATQQNVERSIGILREACSSSRYEIAASPNCFACFIHSNEVDPVAELAARNIRILSGEFFGLPATVQGGRFNLSNPRHAKSVARCVGTTSDVGAG